MFTIKKFFSISKRNCLSALVFACTLGTAAAQVPPITENYLKSLSVEEHYQAIIEYVDEGGIIGRRSFTSDQPFQSGAGISISLTGIELDLYGLSACPSDVIINVYIYDGPCSAAASQYLETELSFSSLVLCRVASSQAEQPRQWASCYALKQMLGVEISQNLEEILLMTGAAYLTRDDAGQPLRKDLIAAEQHARDKQTLIWAPEAKAAWGVAP